MDFQERPNYIVSFPPDACGDGGGLNPSFVVGSRRVDGRVVRRRRRERGSLADPEAVGRTGGRSRDGRLYYGSVSAAGALKLLFSVAGGADGDAPHYDQLHHLRFLRRRHVERRSSERTITGANKYLSERLLGRTNT